MIIEVVALGHPHASEQAEGEALEVQGVLILPSPLSQPPPASDQLLAVIANNLAHIAVSLTTLGPILEKLSQIEEGLAAETLSSVKPTLGLSVPGVLKTR